MSTHFVNTLFGTVEIRVCVTPQYGQRGYYSHYDPAYARTVTVRSAKSDAKDGVAIEPCKVNRTEVRFSYYFVAKAPQYSPGVVDAVEKYKVSIEYGSTTCYRYGTCDSAPDGARDKLSKWVQEFLPLWLAKNHRAWEVAEYEAMAAEYKHLDAEIEAMRKEINIKQEKANIAFVEATVRASALWPSSH